MGKLQSSLDATIEILRDLEEFKRSGSKEAFRKQLGEEYVRRLGAASPDQALAMAMMKGFRKKWAVWDQEGGRIERARRWSPI